MGWLDRFYELQDLREEVRELRFENSVLKRELAAFDAGEHLEVVPNKVLQRITALEAALDHMIKLAKRGANEYCDPESQAEIRTAEAIRENKL